MSLPVRAPSDLLHHGFDTLIDVRSPSEFAEDRVPGAVNLPALSDTERARVGTIYVQEDPFLARKIGAALVARNAAAHLEGPLADMGGGWRPLVYCWRGGQRSGSIATILSQVGWRAETVEGGYQSWRRAVVEALYRQAWPGRVVLLDGNTGTAKTDILSRLARRGVQVLDLEGLAAHRGSVFGAVSRPQPSQKAFETAIVEATDALDPARPLLVEAESSKIGERLIPPALWKAMRGAPRIVVEAPVEARSAYLVRAYADVASDQDTLLTTIGNLRRLCGAEVVVRWEGLAQEGQHGTLARELMERHYDPRYAKSRGEIDVAATVWSDSLDDASLDRLAGEVERALQQL
ncbi:tRNA 2-selenouridine(34) synthase MnmH [Roseitranquillus sediminis]|uniref:tRNA 2-selenouridine(34) synthase MnmH n=1 Tax=Roseitranquillus sediminis TaxID=2809051 RepID=UPI001D0C1A44|nr:tRNA 2-selenouridine(34) synthase MnmH [Roseitranquillus sediminis]MBM9595667.1 tRNA 2-selenouridine(34) synthase MnmH [Roseitranquillus sediminis]